MGPSGLLGVQHGARSRQALRTRPGDTAVCAGESALSPAAAAPRSSNMLSAITVLALQHLRS